MTAHARRIAAALFAVVASSPAVGQSVTLRTQAGDRLTVHDTRALARDPSSGPMQSGAAEWEGLRYELREGRTGRLRAGTVPGTAGQRGPLEPWLAQDPVTREIYLVHVAWRGTGTDLALRAWGGQSWSDPLWLTADAGDDRQPVLAFDDSGDALLAWRHESGFTTTELFKHSRIGLDGEQQVHAFVDLGDPTAYLSPVEGPVRLRSGVCHVAADAATGSAYVVLARPERSEVGVLAMSVAALQDLWGGSAAPVPVTFASVDGPNPMGADQAGGGLGDFGRRQPGASWIAAPWRLELLGAEAYYWFEAERLRGLAFRSGSATRLVTVDRPATDAEGHLRMMLALQAEIRGLSSVPAPPARRAARP